MCLSTKAAFLKATSELVSSHAVVAQRCHWPRAGHMLYSSSLGACNWEGYQPFDQAVCFSLLCAILSEALYPFGDTLQSDA